MANVEIVDRSDMTSKLMSMLDLKPLKTAIVTIDMHKGHLDPAVATMPADAKDSERVIKNAEDVLGFARNHGVPVIHVKLVFRKIPGLGSEGMPVGEVISHGVEGLLLPIGNSNKLSERVLHLLDSPSDRQRFSEAARQKALFWDQKNTLSLLYEFLIANIP